MKPRLNIVERLIYLQHKGLYKISHILLTIFGVEIPKEVRFKDIQKDNRVRFVHRSPGTVIHPKVTIGYRVHIYQNVTIGRSRPWDADQIFEGCEIEDDVIIGAGAKILFGDKKLIVGRGCVIGANAVLTQSTGEYEIWAGMPAKKIGTRELD